MKCPNCQRDIAERSNFCYYCGARQESAPPPPPRSSRRLYRSVHNRKLGGVCAGLADYLDADPTLVRVIWVLLVILPIPFVPAVLGYLVAWLVIPAAPPEGAAAPAGKRLYRSRTDRTFGGVCGGLAEYLGADATIIRVIWAVLSIVPGFIVGGIVAYFLAWLIMPEAPDVLPAPVAQPQQTASP